MKYLNGEEITAGELYELQLEAYRRGLGPQPTPISDAAWGVLAAPAIDSLRQMRKETPSNGNLRGNPSGCSARPFDGQKFVLPIDKSKGRKRSRVIYLPPEALEIAKRLAKQYPEGPLLRNSRGNAWNRNSVRCRFRRLQRELKMPKLCATSLRHSYAHHRLSSGQDALTVAKLMGHTDTRMIATRYGHLEANTGYMQDAANGIGFLPVVDSTPDTPV